jgi:hypothetical protein
MTETQVTDNPAEAEREADGTERPVTTADIIGALDALGVHMDNTDVVTEKDLPRLMGTLVARVYDTWTEVAHATPWEGAPTEFYLGFRYLADRHDDNSLCTDGCCFESLRKLGQVFSLTSLLLARYGITSDMALMMPMSLGLAAAVAGAAVAEPGSLQFASLRLMVENSYRQLEKLAHGAGVGTDTEVSVTQVPTATVKLSVPDVRFWLTGEARTEDEPPRWVPVFSGGMAHVANGPGHDPDKPETTAEEMAQSAYPQVLKYLNANQSETRPVRIKVWDLEQHSSEAVIEGTTEPDAVFPPAYFTEESEAAEVVDAELPDADGSYGHAATLAGADVD